MASCFVSVAYAYPGHIFLQPYQTVYVTQSPFTQPQVIPPPTFACQSFYPQQQPFLSQKTNPEIPSPLQATAGPSSPCATNDLSTKKMLNFQNIPDIHKLPAYHNLPHSNEIQTFQPVQPLSGFQNLSNVQTYSNAYGQIPAYAISPKYTKIGQTSSQPLNQNLSQIKNSSKNSGATSGDEISCSKKESKMKIKKTTVTETINMKEAVVEMEEKIGEKLLLNDFCEKYGIKRRVMFDFLSIMNSLNICTRFSNDEFQWNGAKLDYTLISNIKKTVQHDTRPIQQVINCGEKTDLNFVCYNLISLFFFLDYDVLDHRKVAKLLAPSGPAYRTMLRKLYTISSSLETIGFISRTGKPAEIRLSNIFFEMPTNNVQISSLLNKKRDEIDVYEKRRMEYEAVTQ
ncbi:hypothetical protein TRFO_28542 [Tritrichomonas foetus]|uniref:E2F/DP family winged-helix DNA-binding domain-containing protein n=1 Tax=Tritrichomonas foetus TaxID=1144522 RepID=A0A1J4K2S0_9EUKA|nr:hypothetical protein TRFO_28542 [Tritrichomonas foetus]|eukprot:OHT04044.1 hypothetical protein TRFO_28542 [Tritrichomonas foetus]